MKQTSLVIILLAVFLLASCGPTPPAAPTPTVTPQPTEMISATPSAELVTPSPEPATPVPGLNIDLLFDFPDSNQDLMNRPEGCVMAPNPLDGIDVFNDWVRTQLIPALGDMDANPANVVIDATMSSNFDGHGFIDLFPAPGNALPLQGRPAIFCFDTDLRRYGVVLFKIVDTGGNYRGYRGLILSDESFGSAEARSLGLESLADMSRGEKITNLYMALNEALDYTPEINEMIRLGLRGDVSNDLGIIFAPGFINTTP